MSKFNLLFLIFVVGSCNFYGNVEPVKITPTQVSEALEFPNPNATSYNDDVLPIDASGKFQEILSNMKCKLPCLFNILPGVTKWGEARQIIENIGVKISNNPGGFYENINWPIYGVPLDTNNPGYGAVLSDISITVGDGIVQRLKLYIEAHTGTEISQIWNRYSPEKVFSEFGKPSEIYFDIHMRDLEHFPDYSMLLLYKDDKAAFWFTGRSNTGNETCPHIQENGEITNLEISIANPSSQLDIFPPGWEFWSRQDEKDFLTTEEVFGLTKEEFYQKMLADPATCFNVVPLP
ncbi:MAG: hypothetical protein U0Z26_05170 [Anaerolineales bacterium]